MCSIQVLIARSQHGRGRQAPSMFGVRDSEPDTNAPWLLPPAARPVFAQCRQWSSAIAQLPVAPATRVGGGVALLVRLRDFEGY